jgi:hypothetical protein
LVAGGGTAGALPAPHAPPPNSSPAPRHDGATAGGQSTSSKVLAPDGALPKGWKTSADRAVTVAGDSGGLHVLVADSSKAYQWHTLATLSEPGFTTDLWTGNACVTASGKRAVVVYAPREFTNKPQLMEHGAFAAVVDLASGRVTKLPDEVTFAYFNPGCGTDEDAVLTQEADDGIRTRLLVVDTASGTVRRTLTQQQQITSAVSAQGRVIGARGPELVSIDAGNHTRVLAKTAHAAFSIHPDAQGGVDFLDMPGSAVRARRTAGGVTTTLAQGADGKVGLQSGIHGRVFLTGSAKATSPLPAALTKLPVAADATLSSQGALAVDQAVSANLRSHVDNPLATAQPDGDAPLQIQTEVPATGRHIPFSASPSATGPAVRSGSAQSPALARSLGSASPAATPKALSPATAGSPTSPVDADRTCSVARNDANQQAYQPTPNQVEWAVDMAIRGDLTNTWVRQGGWRSLDGLGTVNPQGMFPLAALTGGGRIPAQVMLGVLAQESNLWQAEGGALPGQTSSPLTSSAGFYGNPKPDPNDPLAIWQINWAKTDCGYGIGQQTDGMKLGGAGAFPTDDQKAVALDYTTNIAVATSTLAAKWNELHSNLLPAPITMNNDSASRPENWFAALWDYNSGFNSYPVVAPATNWGMGWLNNPDNPVYPQTRFAFLNNNAYADAAHPEKWSYEEKVLGWGAWPINTGRSYADDGTLNNGNTAGYQAAWWDNDTDRAHVKPTPGTFCNSSNNCVYSSPPQCEVQHSGDPNCDTPYWYHTSATWKPDCSTTCGHELLTYVTLRTEPGNGNNGAGTMCDNAPPGVSNPLIVDDVSASVPAITDGCGKSGLTDSGTFGFTFESDSAGHYEAKEDLHQIGGGYADHFWYAHTRSASKGAWDTGDKADDPTVSIVGPMAVTGNWKLSSSLSAWTRVLVHLPDTGAATQQAIYTVHLGNGAMRNRVINTRSSKNRWVNLGVYHFVPGSDFQGVSLSNFTPDGQANDDIAWDSVAFAPLPAKPANMVVAMGDSFSSGEGAEDYAPESDIDAGKATWNACRRSDNAWSRLAVLPGQTSTVGALADSLSPSMDYEFTACSGAWTGNADTNTADGAPPNGNDWGGDGQFHEISQIDSGALSADTTLVTLSIGGNDSRFSDLAAACAATDCSDSGYTYGNDTQPLAQAEPALINGDVRQGIENVLTAVRGKAPNAKIVLMGYPELFSSLEGNACLVEYNPGEVALFNTFADDLQASEKAAVQGLPNSANIVFQNPQYVFHNHAVCDETHYINPVRMASDGPGDQMQSGVSRSSIHPNQLGTAAYATALQDALNGNLH